MECLTVANNGAHFPAPPLRGKEEREDRKGGRERGAGYSELLCLLHNHHAQWPVSWLKILSPIGQRNEDPGWNALGRTHHCPEYNALSAGASYWIWQTQGIIIVIL